VTTKRLLMFGRRALQTIHKSWPWFVCSILCSTTQHPCHNYTHWWHHQLYCWCTCFRVQCFHKLAPEAAKTPDTIHAWPIQLLRDSSATTIDYGLLHLHGGHAKLESKHSIRSVLNILSYPFPASPLTLRYFCCYMACQVSYKTILLVFALNTKRQVLKVQPRMNCCSCWEITRCSNSYLSTHYHHRLPPNIEVTAPPQLSFFPLEKPLLCAAFTMAFYGFLRSSEFAIPSLKWQHVQRTGNAYTIFIEQSKTDSFRCGHSIAIYANRTSTCPVKALQLYAICWNSPPTSRQCTHLQRRQIFSNKPPAIHTYNSSSSPEHIIY